MCPSVTRSCGMVLAFSSVVHLDIGSWGSSCSRQSFLPEIKGQSLPQFAPQCTAASASTKGPSSLGTALQVLLFDGLAIGCRKALDMSQQVGDDVGDDDKAFRNIPQHTNECRRQHVTDNSFKLNVRTIGRLILPLNVSSCFARQADNNCDHDRKAPTWRRCKHQ